MQRVPSRIEGCLRCRSAAVAVCVIVFGMIAGCGGPSSDGTVAVTGTVLVDGSPLVLQDGANGGVNFDSTAGTFSGNAKLGVNGAYATRLRPGDYAVSVWTESVPVARESGQMPVGQSLIPEKYRSSRTSGVQVTVPPKGGTVSISLGK